LLTALVITSLPAAPTNEVRESERHVSSKRSSINQKKPLQHIKPQKMPTTTTKTTTATTPTTPFHYYKNKKHKAVLIYLFLYISLAPQETHHQLHTYDSTTYSGRPNG
jgi:hypothetical protein